MDDRDRASGLARAVAVGCWLLLLLVVARSALGDLGVHLALLVAVAVVAVLASGQLTGRPAPRPAALRRRAVVAPPVVPDAWRSERWVAEAVERGLRAIDEWRLEQRDA